MQLDCKKNLNLDKSKNHRQYIASFSRPLVYICHAFLSLGILLPSQNVNLGAAVFLLSTGSTSFSGSPESDIKTNLLEGIHKMGNFNYGSGDPILITSLHRPVQI